MIPDDPVEVKLVNLVLKDALAKSANQIQLDANESGIVVAYCIDGALRVTLRPPLKVRDAVVARIKHMASLDLDDDTGPQEGGFAITVDGGPVLHFQVSVLPITTGERIVIVLPPLVNPEPVLH